VLFTASYVRWKYIFLQKTTAEKEIEEVVKNWQKKTKQVHEVKHILNKSAGFQNCFLLEMI